jgi:hypothetical protein
VQHGGGRVHCVDTRGACPGVYEDGDPVKQPVLRRGGERDASCTSSYYFRAMERVLLRMYILAFRNLRLASVVTYRRDASLAAVGPAHGGDHLRRRFLGDGTLHPFAREWGGIPPISVMRSCCPATARDSSKSQSSVISSFSG